MLEGNGEIRIKADKFRETCRVGRYGLMDLFRSVSVSDINYSDTFRVKLRFSDLL